MNNQLNKEDLLNIYESVTESIINNISESKITINDIPIEFEKSAKIMIHNILKEKYGINEKVENYVEKIFFCVFCRYYLLIR